MEYVFLYSSSISSSRLPTPTDTPLSKQEIINQAIKWI